MEESNETEKPTDESTPMENPTEEPMEESMEESDPIVTGKPASPGNECIKKMKRLISEGELTKDDVMNALKGGKRKRTKRRRGKRSKRTRR